MVEGEGSRIHHAGNDVRDPPGSSCNRTDYPGIRLM